MAEKQTKKKGRLALIVAAAAVLALLFEWAFSALTAPDTAAYQKADLGAETFSVWEFEDNGDGSYYALAYNSYFFAEDLGLGPVQTVWVRMGREAGDATETVLYYTGTVDGVTGEFIAPLTDNGDGSYTAVLNADSVEGLRIYPTETVRSTVTFGGVTVNPVVAAGGTQWGRAPLWCYIFLALYELYSLLRTKGGSFCLWRTGCIFGGALVTAAVFMAGRMFTAVRDFAALLIPAAAAVFTLAWAALWFIAVRLKTPHAKLAATVAAAGILFTFASAPLQAPDETLHYLRTYTVAQGRFDFDYEYDFPNDVDLLVSLFPGGSYHELQQGNGTSMADRLVTYLTADKTQPAFDGWSKTEAQQIVQYIPGAIAMAAVQLFGGGALLSLYAARLANVAVLAVCAYFALRMAKRYRNAIILTALLPLSVYMAASCSYDAFLLWWLLLFLGRVFKAEFTTKDLIWAAVALGCILMTKPLYFPLALFLLLIPKDKWQARIPRWAAILLLSAVGGIAYVLPLVYAAVVPNTVTALPDLAGVDTAAQIRYILTNPLRFLMVVLVDGYMNGFYMGSFGIFGWLDVHTVFTGLFVPALVLVMGILYADRCRRYKKTDWLVYAAALLLSYGLIVSGFYCAWSTLGSTSILGVQARYFIPVLCCVTGLIGKAFSPAVEFRLADTKRDGLAIALCGGVSIFAAAEVLLAYYLI